MPNYFAGVPEVILVGPYEVYVSVVVKIDRKEALGDFVVTTHGGNIRLKKDHRSPQEAADTLLHEINHAIFHFAKLDSGFEEDIVEQFSTWQTGVFFQNPRLLQWIGKCVCGK